MQLEPGEKFIITRQLEDPADTGTYYIRAYIRKAADDSLIATVSLTDKGSQRFRGEWYVPQYNESVYITITTQVFTDSGYTTESMLYGRVEEFYLIQQRWSHVFGGGGGGASINYQKIKDIVKEEILKIQFPESKNITNNKTIKEEVVIDLDSVKKDILNVLSAVKSIKNPEKVDLMPLIEGIQDAVRAINDKEIPVTDLSKVYLEFERINKIVNTLQKKIEEATKEISEKAKIMDAAPFLKIVGGNNEIKQKRKSLLYE